MAIDPAAAARPYAEAAFKYANEAGVASKWQELLDELAHAIKEGSVQNMLDDPRVTASQARAVLESIVAKLVTDKDKTKTNFLNFCQQLLDNDRLNVASDIAAKFKFLHQQSEGVLEAEIRSAYKLAKPKIDAIAKKLKEKFNVKEVITTVTIDESLIAGVMIIAGDQVIDGTMRSELSQMQLELARN